MLVALFFVTLAILIGGGLFLKRHLGWKITHIGMLMLSGYLVWCLFVATAGIISGSKNSIMDVMSVGAVIGLLCVIGVGVLLYRKPIPDPVSLLRERLKLQRQDTGEFPAVAGQTDNSELPGPVRQSVMPENSAANDPDGWSASTWHGQPTTSF